MKKLHWLGCLALVATVAACNVDDSAESGVEETSAASDETSEAVGEAEQSIGLGGFGIDCYDWWAYHYGAIDTDLTYSILPPDGCDDPWGGGDPWGDPGGGGWGSGGFGDPDEEGPCAWRAHQNHTGNDSSPAAVGQESAARERARGYAKTKAQQSCLGSGGLFCQGYVVGEPVMVTDGACVPDGSTVWPDGTTTDWVTCYASVTVECAYR